MSTVSEGNFGTEVDVGSYTSLEMIGGTRMQEKICIAFIGSKNLAECSIHF